MAHSATAAPVGEKDVGQTAAQKLREAVEKVQKLRREIETAKAEVVQFAEETWGEDGIMEAISDALHRMDDE